LAQNETFSNRSKIIQNHPNGLKTCFNMFLSVLSESFGVILDPFAQRILIFTLYVPIQNGQNHPKSKIFKSLKNHPNQNGTKTCVNMLLNVFE